VSILVLCDEPTLAARVGPLHTSAPPEDDGPQDAKHTQKIKTTLKSPVKRLVTLVAHVESS